MDAELQLTEATIQTDQPLAGSLTRTRRKSPSGLKQILQAVIAAVRAQDFPQALQFTNFRD